MALDDLDLISKIDKSRMLEKIEEFPNQIEETIELMNSIEINNFSNIENIIISGMGGSAISGDIIQTIFKNRIDMPIFVNRSYDLPKWAGNNTLVISKSYSGNTEETLNSFKDARKKNCKIINISSGGQLQKYSKKFSVTHIDIPSGYVPRAAVAFILFSTILIFEKIGIIDKNIEMEIKETIYSTNKFIKYNNKKILEKDNISKQIANKIFKTIPQIYGWGLYTPIAKRWRTQFNENSKLIARFDIVPECNHNDIVGWSNDLSTSKLFSCIIFRDKQIESNSISKRLNFMIDLFMNSTSNVIEIEVKEKKTLSKMICTMLMGDFISCYLAVLRKIDPTPIDAIVKLKNKLK